MTESREHIKNRMLQLAAKSWGYAGTEPETGFDPIVALLLSVNAAEFERISGEIYQSRARVLERMVELLSPDMLTGPLPAHAILSATAAQEQVTVDLREQFFFSKKLAAENGRIRTKDIFFTPTGSFHVNRCSVKYMATANKLYQFTHAGSKELQAYNTGPMLGASSLWIGIDHPGESLHNAQFFFQIRNEVLKAFFYTQLPKASWYQGQHVLPTKGGYNDPGVETGGLNIDQVLTQQSTIRHKVVKDVNTFYQHCFITLSDPGNHTVLPDGETPAVIREAFTAPQTKLFEGEQLRWIEIVFPENITATMLEDVSCHLNCMPAINRQLHEITHRMQDVVNILPMITEDLYLDMEDITNQDGEILNVRDLDRKEQPDLSILLRSGGVARFDERDAVSIIENIIQLLRDESAAFARLGKDFIAGEVKQLQQIINKLEQQMLQRQLVSERVPYLLIRKEKVEEVQHIFLRYWSVTGKMGNDIKAGTALMPYRSGALDHSKVFLVTISQGGRDRLSAADSITAYKSAVLSKDRIMSMEDVRLYCLRELGEKVSDIRIEKGVMVSLDEAQGFAKTIDVRIRLHRKDYAEAREKNELVIWEQGLAQQLVQRSLSLIPYRIFIEEAA